ncbi:hypothetical protein Rs2_52548 [Raphanus sativus]|nr:hypothetical protein Rs2_52548 [Raphanus sativus]
MAMCKQTLPPSTALNFPPANFGPNMLTLSPSGPKDKVVVIMGATGTGKSRLSVDLATRFPAEIINSDKIQVHQGLDIVTNKITTEESCGVPHHLLGVLPPEAELTAVNFRHMANLSVESILSRGKLPIIVGGSNSYVEALVDDEDYKFRSRYDCCFLWVDVALPVLHGDWMRLRFSQGVGQRWMLTWRGRGWWLDQAPTLCHGSCSTLPVLDR